MQNAPEYGKEHGRKTRKKKGGCRVEPRGNKKPVTTAPRLQPYHHTTTPRHGLFNLIH